MSKQHINDGISVILAASTSMAIGTFFLQALGAFILGIIGALAGWFFTTFIRPKLEVWRNSLGTKKVKEKA